MSWRLAPSLVVCRGEINARFPGRDLASDGSIGDAAHSSRTSDHNPDEFGIVRAIDVDEDLDGNTVDSGKDAWVIAETLRQSRDPRIKYVIYESMMFSSYDHAEGSAWTWRPYRGVNLHKKHVHISILPSMEAANDTRYWFPATWRGQPLPTPAPTPAPTPTPTPTSGRTTVAVELPVLKRGSKGRDVESLQHLLVGRAGQYVGRSGPDGDFGRATESAVKNVQRFFGAVDDGVVGKVTHSLFWL